MTSHKCKARGKGNAKKDVTQFPSDFHTNIMKAYLFSGSLVLYADICVLMGKVPLSTTIK